MVHIGIIGSGWRTQGYLRVIQEMRDRMEVTAVLAHSNESFQKMNEKFPGKVTQDFKEFTQKEYDFVFVLVPRATVVYYIEELAKRQIPILVETPPADGLADLQKCAEICKKYNAKIQVAEQYFLQPYHQAVMNIVQSGILGEIQSMNIRMIHDYHGISIMRRILGEGFNSAQISAAKYEFQVMGTADRQGLTAGGKGMKPEFRKRADFVFEDGKVGFYDFSNQQYFNYFRTRHMVVQGTLGEIVDDQVCFMGKDGLPVKAQIMRDELGAYSNLEGCGLRGLTFMDKNVYKNPYWEHDYRLSDEEIAQAGILEGMKRFVEGGTPIYPFEEACQDTYLFLKMDESIEEKKTIFAETKTW